MDITSEPETLEDLVTEPVAEVSGYRVKKGGMPDSDPIQIFVATFSSLCSIALKTGKNMLSTTMMVDSE